MFLWLGSIAMAFFIGFFGLSGASAAKQAYYVPYSFTISSVFTVLPDSTAVSLMGMDNLNCLPSSALPKLRIREPLSILYPFQGSQ
jgi:hypothetical protein